MSQCYACKSGKLELSGTHLYCDNCSFSVFTMTSDYIDSCAGLLGTLVSNTQFATYDDFKLIVQRHIQNHLPFLDGYLPSIMSGHPKFLDEILDLAREQAINLQIDTIVHNAREQGKDLVCQCGESDAFTLVKAGELVCTHCDAKYLYDEDEGIYKPEFLCKCGSASYTIVDDDATSLFVMCNKCSSPYTKDMVNNHFYKIS